MPSNLRPYESRNYSHFAFNCVTPKRFLSCSPKAVYCKPFCGVRQALGTFSAHSTYNCTSNLKRELNTLPRDAAMGLRHRRFKV